MLISLSRMPRSVSSPPAGHLTSLDRRSPTKTWAPYPYLEELAWGSKEEVIAVVVTVVINTPQVGDASGHARRLIVI